MAELKTQPTDVSVSDFIAAIPDETRRQDCRTIVEIMKDSAHSDPKMWGSNIVGFGHYHYKYDSGREGDWFLTGFSPRKSALTLYIMAGFDRYDSIMAGSGSTRRGSPACTSRSSPISTSPCSVS